MERNFREQFSFVCILGCYMSKLINDKTQTCENFMSESSQNSVGSKFNYVVFIGIYVVFFGMLEFQDWDVRSSKCSGSIQYQTSKAVYQFALKIVLLFFFPLQNFFVRQKVIQSRNLILTKKPTSAKNYLIKFSIKFLVVSCIRCKQHEHTFISPNIFWAGIILLALMEC